MERDEAWVSRYSSPGERATTTSDDTPARQDSPAPEVPPRSQGRSRQTSPAHSEDFLDGGHDDSEQFHDDDHRYDERRRRSLSSASRRDSLATPLPFEKDTADGGTIAPSQARVRVRYKAKMILRGHTKGVSMVKFSPDGRWIASCSSDATIKIWDVRTGKHIHTMRGHLAGISTIAWSPDSETLASGSDDKAIRLWNRATGQPYPIPLLGHHNYVYSIAFSPKGNMLVSGSYDEAVFLWDVRAGRQMRSLPAHSDPVCGVDFIRDGTLVVSCAGDGLM